MKVKFWGVRGSLPAPHPPEVIELRVRRMLHSFAVSGCERSSNGVESFLGLNQDVPMGGYGGNTACVQVSHGDSQVIIDGGSGIRRLGERLMAGACGRGQGEVHLFFTHFHWDHLVGLPFFGPLFVPGNKIHFHAVQHDLEACVRALFKRPFFPVAFEELRSKITFHRLTPRKALVVGEMSITPYQLDHPDPCWGYRIDAAGKSYAHCVDTEATRVSVEELGPDLPLYQNADLMLFDAQYTLEEALEKINWGHATAPSGIDIALREGVKRILFAHHDPGASDEKIAGAEEQTRKYMEIYRESARLAGRELPSLEWGFAREDQEIDL